MPCHLYYIMEGYIASALFSYSVLVFYAEGRYTNIAGPFSQSLADKSFKRRESLSLKSNRQGMRHPRVVKASSHHARVARGDTTG